MQSLNYFSVPCSSAPLHFLEVMQCSSPASNAEMQCSGSAGTAVMHYFSNDAIQCSGSSYQVTSLQCRQVQWPYCTFLHSSLQFREVHFRTMQYSSVQRCKFEHCLVHISTVLFTSVQHCTLHNSDVHFNAVQNTLVQCCTLQYRAVHFSTVLYTSVQCCTLQYSAVHFIIHFLKVMYLILTLQVPLT